MLLVRRSVALHLSSLAGAVAALFHTPTRANSRNNNNHVSFFLLIEDILRFGNDYRFSIGSAALAKCTRKVTDIRLQFSQMNKFEILSFFSSPSRFLPSFRDLHRVARKHHVVFAAASTKLSRKLKTRELKVNAVEHNLKSYKSMCPQRRTSK